MSDVKQDAIEALSVTVREQYLEIERLTAALDLAQGLLDMNKETIERLEAENAKMSQDLLDMANAEIGVARCGKAHRYKVGECVSCENERLTAENRTLKNTGITQQETIERLEGEIKAAIPHNQERRFEMNRLQARVEELEKVRVAVLKHRDNKEFLNIDTWNACVYAAEAATEQESDPFNDLAESGGLPEAQALAATEQEKDDE